MSVKITPKKVSSTVSCSSDQRLTPDEVKEILTSTIELTEDDFCDALKMMPNLYEQCESEIKTYHDNSCIFLNKENVEECKRIIDIFKKKGGDVLRSVESNLNELWIWIGAKFDKSICFADDLPLLLDWIGKYEITIHTNSCDNGIYSVGFMVQIGKYVNLRGE